MTFFLNLFNKLAFAYRVAKLKLFTSISATDAKTRNVSYNFSKLLIKLKTLSLNFDKIKILKYLGIALIFFMIFGFIMFNANELTSKVPNGSSRYNCVGRLFYQKSELLFIFSFIINLFICLLVIDLLSMLIQGKMELSKSNGIIYRNGMYFLF